MYTVLVVAVTGNAHEIRFGAQGSEVDCRDLARSLSGGIGRDTITVQTHMGGVHASAMIVRDADDNEIARYIDTALVG